jgi:hypothetical protein
VKTKEITMKSVKTVLCAVGLGLLVMILGCSAALAQDGRSFVSGSGSDSNAVCALATPCRTFTHALAQTNSGGEVIVLDSAGYGPFSISQPVSIIAAPGIYAGITVTSGDGIDVSASGTVILRGLTIENAGSTGNGILNTGVGISVLHIENCVVNGFNGANGSTGISDLKGVLELKDSTIRGNTKGVLVVGPGIASIDHVRLEGNVEGLIAQDQAQVNIRNSLAADNTNGLESLCTGATNAELNIENCIASGNDFGIYCIGESTGTAFIRVSDSTVTNNLQGLVQFGAAVLYSRVNNTVQNNRTHNTSGTITPFSAM